MIPEVRIYEADNAARIKEFHEILNALYQKNDKTYEVTASIGCATEAVDDKLNVDAVISRADKEMYKEKSRKRRQE